MTRHGISLLISAFAIGALALTAAALAQDAKPNPDQAPDQQDPAAETPEQIAARELCKETAAPGAFPGWTIKERMTCENSFNEVCRIVRESDGVEAAHTCYEPLPMYDPDAEAGGEEAATE